MNALRLQTCEEIHANKVLGLIIEGKLKTSPREGFHITPTILSQAATGLGTMENSELTRFLSDKDFVSSHLKRSETNLNFLIEETKRALSIRGSDWASKRKQLNGYDAMLKNLSATNASGLSRVALEVVRQAFSLSQKEVSNGKQD